MSTITDHKSRLAWIEALEIPETHNLKLDASPSNRAATNPNDKGAMVAAASVPSFVSGLALQARDDVQNSTLLMQLAANNAYPDEKDKDKWFTFYSDGLARLGWGTTSSVYERYQPKNTNVTMNQVVLEIILDVVGNMSNPLYKIAHDAFGAMNDPANKSPLMLFDQTSTEQGRGKFQILPAGQDQNGTVSMVLTAINAHTDVQTGSFLFWKWSTSSSVLYRAASLIVLNESVYSQVRQAVIAKLGANAKDWLANLKL